MLQDFYLLKLDIYILPLVTNLNLSQRDGLCVACLFVFPSFCLSLYAPFLIRAYHHLILYLSESLIVVFSMCVHLVRTLWHKEEQDH